MNLETQAKVQCFCCLNGVPAPWGTVIEVPSLKVVPSHPEIQYLLSSIQSQLSSWGSGHIQFTYS